MPIDRTCRFCEHSTRWDTSGAAVCGLDDKVRIASPNRIADARSGAARREQMAMSTRQGSQLRVRGRRAL
jgi:hypothetical protein